MIPAKIIKSNNNKIIFVCGCCGGKLSGVAQTGMGLYDNKKVFYYGRRCLNPNCEEMNLSISDLSFNKRNTIEDMSKFRKIDNKKSKNDEDGIIKDIEEELGMKEED